MSAEDFERARIQVAEAQRVREESFEKGRQYQLERDAKPSRADEYAEGWDELDQPLRDGWNIEL